ncbi:MAG: hypothetical protein JWL76_1896 [Thermoleophilia bacterium]|nr:hypothetical protein [Thermoleophilia bacterium]
MTISGTQGTGGLPARGSAAPATTNRGTTVPASGDHGTAASPAPTQQVLAQLQKVGVNTQALGLAGKGAAGGASMIAMPAPYSSPFDRINDLLSQLMDAIQQLNQPPFDQYPPYDPYGPYGPYPPIDPPYCPHMDMYPPIPVDPIPPLPPVTKKAPEVGDVLGTIMPAPTKGASGPGGQIKVKSVHGTYTSRDKAVAAAKHLAGIFGNKPFGVAVSGLPGQEKYSVVGLSSTAPLKASDNANIVGDVRDGWALETIAYSAKTAKHVAVGTPPAALATPGPAAPPSPTVPAPVPAPHTH